MPFIQRWNALTIVASFILISLFSSSLLAQETVSFTVSNGAEIRCAADSTVEIIISPNLSDNFTEINLLWGDGAIETILPGQSLTRIHTFSTYQFFEEDCDYLCAVNPLINGFCFNVSILATYENITDENASKIITYKTPPRVMFLPDQTIICEGEEICFSNATCPSNDEDMVYTWNFGNGVTTSSTDTCIVYPTAGSYSVTLTATNTCGSDTETQNIVVLGLPTADVGFMGSDGSQDTLACAPYTVSFNNLSTNGTTYQWEIFQDGGIVLDSTTFMVMPLEYTFTEAGTYTVSMTTRSVCGDEIWEQIFTINEAPSVVLEQEPPACESLTYTPDVTYAGGNIDSYSWTFEGGTPSTSSDPFPTDIIFNTPGMHLVTLDIGSLCGVESTSIIIDIQTPAAIVIDPIPMPLCFSPDSILLGATPLGGVWMGMGVVEDSLFVSSLAGEGTHLLYYTFGSGVCEATDSIQITVRPQQIIDAGDDIALCIEDTTLILQGFSPPDGEWTGLGITSNMPPSFDPNVAMVGTHDLTYTFIDADGCIAFDVISATVEALPTFQVPDTIIVCNIGGDIDLGPLANISPSPSGGTAFWDGPGIINNSTGVFNAMTAGGMGSYEISYTYTTNSLSACQLTDTFIVNVIEPTEAIAQTDESLCITEDTYFLSASPLGGTWSGPGIVDATTGEIDLNLAGGNPGHIYTYTIFAGTSCEMSDDVMIEIIDFTGVNAGPDVVICESENGIQLMGSNGNTGLWNGLVPITPNGFVDLMFLDTGMHQFIYTLASDVVSSCAVTDTMQLTVVGLPEVAFSVDSACIGIAAQFTNETIGAVTYSWDFGSGTSTAENPTFTFNSFGDFPVNLTAFTENDVCENTLTQVIHISQPPELVTFAPIYQDSCAELDVVLNNGSIGENLDFLWYEGNNLISTGNGPINITLPTGRTDTTYYFQLEVANNCGGEIALDSVHVSPTPVAYFGTDQNNYCSGEEVNIINISYGNPITYSWNFGDPDIPNTMDVDPTSIFYLADSMVTRTISLITTNECGSDTLDYDINIHPTEVVAFFNIQDSTVCVGDSICFSNFSTFGSDLVYDFGDGNSSTDSNPCHVYQTAGVYVVNLTATACGFDHTTRTITVLPAPEVNFYAPPLVCLGDEVLFSDSSVNVVSYLWDFGDDTSSPLSSPVHLYDSLDQFTVTLTGTAANGCSHSLSQTIETVGLPIADFISNDSICAGSSIIFTNNSVNTSSCFWDFGDGNFSSDCDASHIYTLGDTTYVSTLVVTNAAGCMDTLSRLVYIRANPIPNFEFEDNLCSPALITFTNLSEYADSYEWTFSNGETSTDTHPNILFDNEDTFSVNLQATNDGICIENLELPITLHATPTADFTPSTPSACADDELVFNNESTGNVTSQKWTFGAPDGVISFLESPTFTFDSENNYIIELIVNTDFCADTIQQTFIVHEALEADFTSENLICFGEAIGAIDLNINAGTMPFQYDWSNGATTQDISELAAGQYQIDVLDINGCQWTNTIDITQPDPITIDIVDETIVSCFGGNDGAISVETQGGQPNYTYNWSTGASGSMLSNMFAGTYQLSITDANGCNETLEVNIHENPPIEIVDTVSNISCFGFGDGEILIDSIIGGSPIFNLTLTGPVNYQSVNRRFGELLAGSYQLTLEDAEGCTENYQYQIEEPDSIFVDIIQEDTTIVLGAYVDLTSNFNAVDPVFSWNPNRGLDCTDCFDPEARPFYDVHYQITMTDANDCVAQDDVSIMVNQTRDVFVPDAFTPNGDGHNDVFRVRSNAISIEKIREFTVVDRWGAILFQAKDYPLNDIIGEWNGETKEGNAADAGVYVWYAVIDFIDGKSVTEKGDVTLIR